MKLAARTKCHFMLVDSNYNPILLYKSITMTNQLLHVFDIPKTIGIQSTHTNSTSNTNVQPPGNYIASAVHLPDICVFRI